jgi:hypothetical protein
LESLRETARNEVSAVQQEQWMSREKTVRQQSKNNAEQPPMEPHAVRGRAADRKSSAGKEVACRSLLIPRFHFGAAGSAGAAEVFRLAAGRFLPLAGAVGSSCA